MSFISTTSTSDAATILCELYSHGGYFSCFTDKKSEFREVQFLAQIVNEWQVLECKCLFSPYSINLLHSKPQTSNDTRGVPLKLYLGSHVLTLIF